MTVDHARLKKLGLSELTEGTETSKYLEEEKSIEILLVAASERRIAQTSKFTYWGCRTVIKGQREEELLGKVDHRG